MKRFLALAILCISVALGANAQHRGSMTRGGGSGYQRVYPSRRFYGGYYDYNRPYVGLRVGPTFSSIHGDDINSGVKSGLNVGIAAGFPISGYLPIYLESGLYYTEKGGKHKDYTSVKLDYIELPLVFKYKAGVSGLFTLEPYFGGYAALGVGGKYKALDAHVASSSFDYYKRGDAGIKLGCGMSAGLFYMDLNYDWGLVNINNTKNSFDDARTGALTLNFGLTF